MIHLNAADSSSMLLHGGDYNPEQWLDRPHVITEDFELFAKAGINTITVGVFSWSTLEPEPDVFVTDWLADVLQRAASSGIGVILATPSGAMPAWLASRWPEAMRMQASGRRPAWSWRHHHCWSSPAYRDRVAIIDRVLSERFGRHPAVRLWHLGNEPGGACYCPRCIDRFRTFLFDRYGSLESLNQRWCNAVWSHQLGSWDQIHPFDSSNDAQQLAWKRFTTHIVGEFLDHEIQSVRTGSNLPVTTNFMGCRPDLNPAELAGRLDLVSDDQYPEYFADHAMPEAAMRIGLTQDCMRGLKRGRPWLLMESTPSVTNKMKPPRLKRPGIHRLQMAQAVAHGALGTLYFQWRQPRGQREKFHGAVIEHGPDAGHSRTFKEVADWGRQAAQWPAAAGAEVPSQVALVLDWENWWAMNTSCGPDCADAPQHDPKRYFDTLCDWYAPFWMRGIPVDVVPAQADLSPYRLVVAPMLFMPPANAAESRRRFLDRGGRLVLTYLSGLVDSDNQRLPGPLPGGGIAALAGVRLCELDGVRPSDAQGVAFLRSEADPPVGAVLDYAERIEVTDAVVEAVYTTGFYQHSAALTRRTVGKGEVWYVAARTDRSWIRHLVDRLVSEAGIEPLLGENGVFGMTCGIRQSDQERMLFAMNFTGSPGDCVVRVPGRTMPTPMTLGPFECRVIRQNPADDDNPRIAKSAANQSQDAAGKEQS